MYPQYGQVFFKLFRCVGFSIRMTYENGTMSNHFYLVIIAQNNIFIYLDNILLTTGS
jgi:hypothetical protein